MLEKIEVGKDTKECFTEMSKYRKMQDGLGSEMMQLDSPELKKSIEELIHWKCKTAFHKITEHNGFKCTFEGIIFPFACVPLYHSLILEKTNSLQFLYSCFRHFAFAPAHGKICNLFIFNFGLVLLESHLNVMSYAPRLGGYERG